MSAVAILLLRSSSRALGSKQDTTEPSKSKITVLCHVLDPLEGSLLLDLDIRSCETAVSELDVEVLDDVTMSLGRLAIKAT